MKKLPNWVKNTFYSLAFILIVVGLFLAVNTYYKVLEGTPFNRSLAMNLPYNTEDYLYLSDIDYVSNMSYVKDGYYFKKDKNNLNGLIEVNVKDPENNIHKETFIKGVSAWATSEIVYDVEGLDYDYFTAYVGVDANQTSDYYNSGVRFTIYTSLDGETWENVYTSSIKKGVDAADFVKISLYENKNVQSAQGIEGPEIFDDELLTGNTSSKGQKVKYLKLYAYENGNSWYSHWHDDAVYANAKLIKEGYEEKKQNFEVIKTISEYDREIKELSNLEDFTNLEEYQNLLLERELVSRVGYDILQALFNYSEEYQDIIKTLFNDKDILELYLLGGEPDGNYVESLKILKNLLTTYGSDFSDPVNGELYKKMAISLSLTHSANVGLWVSGAPEDPDDPNGSNAIDRYLIYKKLYKAGKLNNAIFTDLSVEEMRFVMNNIIDDEEIIWLNDFVRKNNSFNPYTYINYTFGYDYTLDKYYDLDKRSEWNNKKHGNLEYAYHFDDGEYFEDTNNFIRSDYNITYQKGYPKLWIVFEEGSVCGGLSKTGSNIEGVYGIPSSVVSQPGHAAYIYMDLTESGEKYWRLYNDVSGWGQSGKTEKLSVRMPNGWGDGNYVGSYPATYVLLAQSALNDLDNYEKSEKVMMLANIYSNHADKIKIYEEALSIQNINFDAWLGLVNAYKENKASDLEYANLADRIIKSLRNYPLPMDDLLKLIQNNMASSTSKTDLINLTKETLQDIKDNPDKNYIQNGAATQVATYLLQTQEQVATFSFDGEGAKTIELNSEIITDGAVWEYTVDSGEHWQRATGLTHTLTDEEVDTIHHETEILIKIVGESTQSVYEIPIEVSHISPKLTYSDKENKIITDNDNNSIGYSKAALEWKLSTDSEDKWTKLEGSDLDLSGNKNIDIRVGRHANFLASDKLTLEFTAIGENDEYLYVDNNKIKVDSVSSEETKREDNKKENVLDDNLNTMWHTDWNGNDNERYIILKLAEPTLISALEYVPRQGSTNGIVTEAEISTSMDGVNYTNVEMQNSLVWASNNSSKYAVFKKPVEALYVKLHGKQTLGDGRSFMSASSISLFEDATAKSIPTADVEYSETTETMGPVTAKLVNASKYITVTNGSDTYTFYRNGTYTFEFVDDYGNKGKTEAKVTWIIERQSSPTNPDMPGIEEPTPTDPGQNEPTSTDPTDTNQNNNNTTTSPNVNTNNSSSSSTNNSSNSNPSTNNNDNNKTDKTTNNSTNVNSSTNNQSNNSSNNNSTNDNNSIIESSNNNEDQDIDTNINDNSYTNEDTSNELLNNETYEEENNFWTSPEMILVYVVSSLGTATLIGYILYKKRYLR